MQQGEIILYQPDETVRLEVRLEDDTVWLNQAQMGELFGTNRQAITKHLQNIYDCEELKKESTSSILELVRREGNRNVRRKIDFFVRTSLPPVEGIFYDGQIFDAYKQIVSLIRQARQCLVLIDNYIDETTLTMLSKRAAGVSAIIYTRPLSQQLQLDLQRHNQQYAPITVNICQLNHDRFLLVDDEVYLFGANLKDAGKKLFAYIKMQAISAAELLNGIR